MKRTHFIVSAAAALIATTGFAPKRYAVTHSDAEWRRILGPGRFAILRENGTEPANSSPLIGEHRPGTYYCYGCHQALFSSRVKYDSGDGWPSFWTVLPHAVDYQTDHELIGEVRTEVHCSRCGGHLGHRFDDGPKPTGWRYCIDGLSLRFVPGHAA